MTTSPGYVLAAGTIDSKMFLVIFALFLLASGGTALNSVQDWKLDKIMLRTAQRPIPSGKISPKKAFIISITLIFLGLFLLLLFGSLPAFIAGLMAIILYNGIYTPLKRKISLAFIPGALVGTIPPLCGYTSVENFKITSEIIFLCFFYFMFQIPHTWLLLMKYKDDYKQAGLPIFTDKVPQSILEKITLMWIFAILVLSFLFILKFSKNSSSSLFLFILILFIILIGFKMLQRKEKIDYQYIFKALNTYILTFSILFAIIVGVKL